GDAANLFAFRSDPQEQRYNSRPMAHPAEAAALIAELRAGYREQTMLHWAVTERGSDTVIGLFGFNAWDRGHQRAEIGYDLARPYWRRGIAFEAMTLIVEFGFERMELHRIETETIADNTASVRLLQKLGFQRE